MTQSFKAMAQRIVNAETNFVENVVEQFGFSEKQAQHILTIFIKEKAVKLDVSMGRYNLTHGIYWDKDVMITALAIN